MHSYSVVYLAALSGTWFRIDTLDFFFLLNEYLLQVHLITSVVDWGLGGEPVIASMLLRVREKF